MDVIYRSYVVPFRDTSVFYSEVKSLIVVHETNWRQSTAGSVGPLLHVFLTRIRVLFTQ